MLNIQSSTEEIFKTAAQLFVAAACDAIDQKGFFTVVLTGGSSPEGLYKLLSEDQYKNQIDWTKVLVFWGDERWVPLDMLTGIALTAVSAIVPLVVWHLKLGKQQVEYVKEYFGDDYPRRSLVFVVPFGILGGYVAMFTISYILMTLYGILGILHSSWL